MNRHFSFFFSILFVLSVSLVCEGYAQSITETQATMVCDRFLQEHNQSNTSFKFEEGIRASDGTVCLYRFSLEGTGFVVVSASTTTPPVLAYSFDDNFEMIAPVRDLFYLYEQEIQTAEKNGWPARPQAAADWHRYLATEFVPVHPKQPGTLTQGPLLTTKWNQNKFYNTYCPWDVHTGAYYDYRVPNGCVALASSQIMNYHQYPPKGQGAASYLPNGYPRQTVFFGQHTYNWEAMCNEPQSYANEIAKIAHHFGVSIHMNYNYDGSGALSEEAMQQLHDTFIYDESIAQHYRGNYLDTVVALYIALLKGEINARRPVYYSGCTEAYNSCHAYVLDGYDNEDRFHLNFGWGGSANGFFAIDNFVGGGSHWDYQGAAIVNIFPSVAVADTYCQGLKRQTASFGYISDGSRPTKPYSANPDCSWMIAVPTATRYHFSFDRLDVNPDADVVTIYNGPTIESGVKQTFTGSTVPTELITVNADSVLITFTSNGSVATNNDYYGWLISYSSEVAASYCNSVTPVNDWHTILTDGSGEGEKYVPESNCTWNVSLNYISGYSFSFPKFNLGYGDFVDVYNNATNPPTFYKRFDIYNMPNGSYRVPFSKMRINFVADNWDQGDGFQLEYWALASIDDHSGLEDMTICPNPANDQLNITFSMQSSETVNCRLTDATGKVLQIENLKATSGENRHSIDVSNLANGFYMLELSTNKGKTIRKIMVQ